MNVYLRLRNRLFALFYSLFYLFIGIKNHIAIYTIKPDSRNLNRSHSLQIYRLPKSPEHSKNSGLNWIGLLSAEHETEQSQQDLIIAARTTNLDIGCVDMSYVCPARARDHQWSSLSRNHNIIIFNKVWNRRKINSFLDYINTYVSLHQSEGFGMPISEAMGLGRCVIATGSSGNMGFLNKTNGFPVDYSSVTIEKQDGPYEVRNRWTNPSTDHGAECMRTCYRNQDYSTQLRGRKLMKI